MKKSKLSFKEKRKIKQESKGYTGYIIASLALILVGVGFFIYQTQTVSTENPIIASDRPNILILPFNSIGAEEDTYISEGITDTLIGTLLKFTPFESITFSDVLIEDIFKYPDAHVFLLGV